MIFTQTQRKIKLDLHADKFTENSFFCVRNLETDDLDIRKRRIRRLNQRSVRSKKMFIASFKIYQRTYH